jgi:hypothetical protein
VNYREMYQALPPKAQRAIRQLMRAILECDTRHPVVRNQTCTSSLETGIAKILQCTGEIKKSDEESRAPTGYLRSAPYVYEEDLRQ